MRGHPLIISDCDEVLLHMVVPFRQWLDETHDIHFEFNGGFADALRHKSTGDLVEQEQVWPLLEGFFESEMHRQMPIMGAVEAMKRLGARADVVILTNIGKKFEIARAEQLHGHGIPYRVVGNRGGKGDPVLDLIDHYRPSMAMFIDDLGAQHKSVSEATKQVWRLQLVGEPELAPNIAKSRHAHARMDNWADALRWIENILDNNIPLPKG